MTKEKIKAFAYTDEKLEHILSDEIKDLLDVKSKTNNSCVTFQVEDKEDLFKFTYTTQSSDRVGLLFEELEFENFDDFVNKIEKNLKIENLKEFIDENTSFKVFCERRGTHNFSSVMAEQEIGRVIIEKFKEENKSVKVDFKTPDIIILCFVKDNKAYLGLDLTGRDLSKRQYRIFTNQGIINAKLAYALARFSGYNEKMKMIDLNCSTGIIPIEIALWKNEISASFYNKDFAFKKIPKYNDFDFDKFFKKLDGKKNIEKLDVLGLDPLLRNVEASKKNAKLAGVDKVISFSKMDVEWLGAKIEDETVDLVISRIQSPNQRFGEGMMRHQYKDLFEQAHFFLKKKGKLCLLSENLVLLRACMPKNFKIIKEETFFAGKLEYEVVIIQKD